MISLLLLIVGIILTAFVYSTFCEKINIVLLSVYGIVFYFCSYIVFSGILFWLDCFNVKKAQMIVVFVMMIFCILRRKNHMAVEVIWDLRPYIIPIIIILCALPFIWNKYEFFGMGQDEGVYQTQAIQFIYDETQIQRDFEEYAYLSSDSAKEDFKQSLQEDLIGLYNYDTTLPFASAEKEISPVSAIFHAIPTFPAIMAIFGKILGISHMSAGQNLFYICSIFLIYSVMEKLKIKKSAKIVGTAIFAISPLILWVAKSALTEIVLVCLILGFIELIIDMRKEDILWSALPIVAFAFFHFTIYTMIPVFFITYVGLYIYHREPRYFIANLIVTTGFVAGMFMAWIIAGTYTFTYNMGPLYKILPFLNQENVVRGFVWIMCGVYILCGLIWVCRSKFDALCRIGARAKYVMIWLCCIGAALYQVKYLIEHREQFQGGVNTLRHMSLMGFAYVTGIVLPVVAGILTILAVKKIFQGIQGSVIAWLFIYCILIYTCVMRPETKYYYYYGRYLAPFISIIILFSAVALQQLPSRFNYLIGLGSLMVLLPYEGWFIKNLDDTRMVWDVLESFSENIEEDSVVIVSKDDMKFFYLPMRAMANCFVFPETEAILKDVEQHPKVYYIKRSDENMESHQLLLSKTYGLREDNNEFDGSWIPFPMDVFKREDTMMLWKKIDKK